MRVTVRPDAEVDKYSVVVIFDKAMGGFDLFSTTMRVATVMKRSVTFVNEFYNGNTTDVEELSFLVTGELASRFSCIYLRLMRSNQVDFLYFLCFIFSSS